MMSTVKIFCTSNSEHLSLTVDSSTEKGKNTVFWIISQGNCPMCDSPLQITQQAEMLARTPTSVEAELAINSTKSSDVKHLGTKPIRMPSDLIASDLCSRSGSVSAHISQLLPIRAAVDVLADMIHQSKSPLVPLSKFKEPSELLSGIRFELIELENQNQLTKRGFRPSAGFPFHYEEDMPQMWSKTKVRGKPRTKKSEEVRKSVAANSWSRFRITVFGGIRDDGSAFGALYDLGLAHIQRQDRELLIGLTLAGAELANLENPLIHTNDFTSVPKEILSARFSDEERQWFWNHVNKHINVEVECLRRVIMMTRNEDFHVQEITEELVKNISHVRGLKSTGTPPARRAYASSLVNRWTGLGYLERPSSGRYQATELGLKVLSEYQAKHTTSWKKSGV